MQPQVRTQIKQKNLYQPIKEGLTVWVDATDYQTINESAGRVSAWKDKSGKGNDFVQATGALQPLYVASAINGLPAIQGRDDGTTKQLRCNDNTNLDYTEFTSFVVISRVADLGAIEYIAGKFDPGSSAREHAVQITAADAAGCIVSAVGSASLGTATASGTIALATPTIIQARFSLGEGLTSTQLKQTSTGTLATSAIFAGTAPYTLLSIKNGATESQEPFAGYLGEHLFYNRALNNIERLHNINYLSKKWKISI